jgi:hypothetical protein
VPEPDALRCWRSGSRCSRGGAREGAGARLRSSACLAAAGAGGARAGPYTEPGYAPGVVQSWATSVVAFDARSDRHRRPGRGDASFGAPEYALGPATSDVYDVFSLGDGGRITLFVAGGIANAAGDDFAVFENGFYAPGGLYGELAFVEVSSNGVDFARFPATSLRASPVPGGSTIDPTDYHNLAGKHPLDRGTGFDLADLAQHPLVGPGQARPRERRLRADRRRGRQRLDARCGRAARLRPLLHSVRERRLRRRRGRRARARSDRGAPGGRARGGRARAPPTLVRALALIAALALGLAAAAEEPEAATEEIVVRGVRTGVLDPIPAASTDVLFADDYTAEQKNLA